MNIRHTLAASAVVLASVMAAGSAGAATYFVPGTADPYLAGAGPGDSITWDTGDIDTYAGEAPVGIAVTPGQTVTITYLSGTANHGSCCALAPPTGDGTLASTHNITSTTGYTNLVKPFINLPFDSLVGVFYDPTNSNPIDNTVFEIGFGGKFLVPTDTTELFLGTVDSYQWNNNQGGFNIAAAVPEPATWAMLLLGFGAIGWTLRGRKNAVGAAA